MKLITRHVTGLRGNKAYRDKGLIWEAVFGGRGRGGRKGWWREWGRSVVEEFGEDDDVALSVTWMMR